MTRDLRWNCQHDGCYNQTLAPRLGAFDDCFPPRVGLMDIDGFVELGERFLFLEWKSDGAELTAGQSMAFRRLTTVSQKLTVIVVSGEPRGPTVSAVQVIYNGQVQPKETTDFDGFCTRLRAWAARAAPNRIAA